MKHPKPKIWTERPANPQLGIAEIYVLGGRFKYIEKTCVGRIYQKHLSQSDALRLMHAIERAIVDFADQKSTD